MLFYFPLMFIGMSGRFILRFHLPFLIHFIRFFNLQRPDGSLPSPVAVSI